MYSQLSEPFLDASSAGAFGFFALVGTTLVIGGTQSFSDQGKLLVYDVGPVVTDVGPTFFQPVSLTAAGERFTEADKTHTTKLQALLQPVEATLKRYEEGLQRVEKERVDHYAGLREAVERWTDAPERNR